MLGVSTAMQHGTPRFLVIVVRCKLSTIGLSIGNDESIYASPWQFILIRRRGVWDLSPKRSNRVCTLSPKASIERIRASSGLSGENHNTLIYLLFLLEDMFWDGKIFPNSS